ncbi:MAG: Mur ligase family protein, partial [Bacillota bacterium]
MAPQAALLGLGIENLALARYLLARGYEIAICDRRSEADLGERLQELRRAGVILRLGPDYLRGLEEFPVLYRSPGLPLFHPALEAARAAGCRITSAIRLFFALCPVPIIGVTGTKGKGTTASLIFQILQQDRAEKGGRVWLGGNIGVAPFSFLEEIGPQDLVVLELSSFQLEDLDRSPAIGVVTNITPEHLAPSDPNNPNYHRSFADYVAAKANILVHQGPEGVAVLNADDPHSQLLAERAPGKKIWFGRQKGEDGCYVADHGQGRWIYLWRNGSETPLCPVSAVRLRGEHNLQNICAAAAAATAAGAGPD